jgi:hypothetical protein
LSTFAIGFTGLGGAILYRLSGQLTVLCKYKIRCCILDHFGIMECSIYIYNLGLSE